MQKLVILVIFSSLVAAQSQRTRPAQARTVSCAQTANMFKSVASWTRTNRVPAKAVRIRHCQDGTAHNPRYSVSELRLTSKGNYTADTIPPTADVEHEVTRILDDNGWKKCTPDNDEQGDYYSNEGPWFATTYIKNGRLLQLDVNYSQGVGNSVQVQFECDK